MEPFRAINDGERVNQGAVIVARIRDLAEQEQHPPIKQRLKDIAFQFERQINEPLLPELTVWLHELAAQLQEDNQAFSEWRHPYPLPSSQPTLLNSNLLLFLHSLADSLNARTLREFFQLLAVDFPPPVETLSDLEVSVIENIPDDLQQRLLNWLRPAYNDYRNTFDRRSILIRRAYQVLQPAPHPMEWLCQLAVLIYQQIAQAGDGVAQQEQNAHFQEWLSQLRLQLQFDDDYLFRTAFLRDMVRRRLKRLEPLLQLSEFSPEEINAYLAAQYLELIPLLERAREESESELATDPFWNNETKWLGHIIADL